MLKPREGGKELDHVVFKGLYLHTCLNVQVGGIGYSGPMSLKKDCKEVDPIASGRWMVESDVQMHEDDTRGYRHSPVECTYAGQR